MDLDFSILNDDQLVALIRAACQEAIQRGSLVQRMAQDVILDESEKAQIVAEAQDRVLRDVKREEAIRLARDTEAKIKAELLAQQRKTEADKVRTTWAYKEELGQQISAILQPKEPQECKVWLRGADKRVYIGGGFRANIVTYYHTGTHRCKPGLLEIDSRALYIQRDTLPTVQELLREILAEVCRKWNTITIPVPAWTAPTQEGI